MSITPENQRAMMAELEVAAQQDHSDPQQVFADIVNKYQNPPSKQTLLAKDVADLLAELDAVAKNRALVGSLRLAAYEVRDIIIEALAANDARAHQSVETMLGELEARCDRSVLNERTYEARLQNKLVSLIEAY